MLICQIEWLKKNQAPKYSIDKACNKYLKRGSTLDALNTKRYDDNYLMKTESKQHVEKGITKRSALLCINNR